MTRVLITGGTGLLGLALQASAPPGIDGWVTCTAQRTVSAPLPFPILRADLTDAGSLRAAFERAQPELVIHTAAQGSVDFAENNREIARAVNVDGTQAVVELCRRFNARLIHVSSNAVFDGRNPMYAESAPTNPVNYYGQLKLEAERLVQESGLQWAIVRTIMMYGWPYPAGRDNPVVWWIRTLEHGKPLRVVNNVFSKPLPAWSCAEVVWTVGLRAATGIFHAAGSDHVSLHEFCLQTADVFGLNRQLIEAVPDSYFPEIAPRPKDTSFDTTKIQTELGLKPVTIKEGLQRMKAERGSFA